MIDNFCESFALKLCDLLYFSFKLSELDQEVNHCKKI